MAFHDRRLHRPPRRIERRIIPKPLLDQPTRQIIQHPAPARPGHAAPRHPPIGFDQVPHIHPPSDPGLGGLPRIIRIPQPPATPLRRRLLAPAAIAVAISPTPGAIPDSATSGPRPANIRSPRRSLRPHASLLRDHDRRRHHNRHHWLWRHHLGSLRLQIRRRRSPLRLATRRRPRPHLLLGRRWRRRRRIEHLQRIAHRRRHRHHQPVEQRITQHPRQHDSTHRRPDPVSRPRLIPCHHADLVSLSPKQSPAKDEPALARGSKGAKAITRIHSPTRKKAAAPTYQHHPSELAPPRRTSTPPAKAGVQLGRPAL